MKSLLIYEHYFEFSGGSFEYYAHFCLKPGVTFSGVFDATAYFCRRATHLMKFWVRFTPKFRAGPLLTWSWCVGRHMLWCCGGCTWHRVIKESLWWGFVSADLDLNTLRLSCWLDIGVWSFTWSILLLCSCPTSWLSVICMGNISTKLCVQYKVLHVDLLTLLLLITPLWLHKTTIFAL